MFCKLKLCGLAKDHRMGKRPCFLIRENTVVILADVLLSKRWDK